MQRKMKKSILSIVLVFLLTGCMESAAMLSGPTLALVNTTNNVQSSFALGASYGVKKVTGKTFGEHTFAFARKNEKIDNYFKKNEKIRECEIVHSSILSEIFFETLDEIDCESNS